MAGCLKTKKESRVFEKQKSQVKSRCAKNEAKIQTERYLNEGVILFFLSVLDDCLENAELQANGRMSVIQNYKQKQNKRNGLKRAKLNKQNEK